MAGDKQHDFHIVDPSPWPFLGALGGFAMLTGAVFWMNGMTPYVFWGGLALILYVSYAWWADVVKEAHQGDHTPVVRIGLRYGVALFIISEVMFFAAWFWMFFKHAIFPMDGEVLPSGAEAVDPWHLPLLNTLILLTSSAACTWAHHAIMEGDRRGLVNGLIVTVALGAIFTGVQVYEYTLIPWLFEKDVYIDSFLLATGFHGLHVLIGTIFLLVCLIRAARGHFSGEAHIGLEAAAWYWHFVDVVWLFLFAGIYVGTAYGL